ncbi:unnamed protein product [Rotaria socialis]|uniref:Uncharacterized protein n=1 Tax=Rotaria socialis TaxID=392032 RepID=A0A818JEZ1_9BILA|nr:unnamed protein product [Rotaria socialis]
MLHSAQYPHNEHVTYTESIWAVESWKAKHSRLFVLYLGVPIAEDVNFAEKLIHYYCRTIADVYDESLELYSLHAHLHLPSQVRLHGGLSTSSAFTFESCIKYLKSKVHGTKHLVSQIAYWYDVETMIKITQIEIAVPCGINKINIQNEQMNDYRHTLMNIIRTHGQDVDNISFYKRYKQLFITFHTVLYDQRYKCRSYIISYVTNRDVKDTLSYGNIIVFYQYMNQFYAFIQKYYLSRKKLSHSIELPVEVCNKLDEMYSLLALSNDYDIIPILTFHHKFTIKDRNKSYVGCCLCEGSLTEIEAAADRLDKEMNTDLESDCEIVMNFDKSNASQELSQYSMVTTPSNPTGSTMRSLLMTSFDNGSSAYQTLNDIQRITKDKNYGEGLEISTSEEDIDEEEDESDDGNNSSEERVAISTSTASTKG